MRQGSRKGWCTRKRSTRDDPPPKKSDAFSTIEELLSGSSSSKVPTDLGGFQKGEFCVFSDLFYSLISPFSGSEEDDPHLQEERKQSLPLMPSTSGVGGSATPGAASSTSSSRPRSPRPKLTREKEQVKKCKQIKKLSILFLPTLFFHRRKTTRRNWS